MGHTERRNEERMPKMILNSKIESGRRRGRARKRWVDDLESDLGSLGIRNWKAQARNRNNGRQL